MLHEINPFFQENYMQKIVYGGLLILLLIPFSHGFSQEYSDNTPTLSVSLENDTPFVYQDADGYTVVVGVVENNNALTAITDVRLRADFFDKYGFTPLEITEGGTVLDVIPPNGKSPYVIRSQTPNADISEASVSLATFDSSQSKLKGLTVYSSEVHSDTSFRLSGILQTSGASNTNTNVYVAFYDSFEPPRILGVSTIDLGDVEANSKVTFELDEEIDSRSVGVMLFAESDVFSSNLANVQIPPPQSLTKLVTISDVSVKDPLGNNLSEIKIGSTVNIESETWVQFVKDQHTNETPYTYYVQIKESGTSPYVEFIGKYDGRFIGTGLQSQTIDWIPEKEGLFFIETFVWDRNNIPIAEQGPFVLILVN